MNNFRKNIISIYSVNLINGLAGIFFIPLALKGLGVEGYGLYSMFTLFSSYVIFIELGITKYFTRDLAKEKTEKKQKKIMQLAIGIYLRITLLLILITPIALYIVPKFLFPLNNDLPIVEIILLFAIFDYLFSIPTSILKTYNIGNEFFMKVSKFSLISGLSRHLFLIIGVVIFESIIPIMAIVIIRRIIEVLYAIKYLSPLPSGSWKPRYSKGSFKSIISKSIFLSAAQVSQVLVLTLGTYLVNKYYGLYSLGIYKSSFDLAAKVWFFSNSIGIVVFPRFSSLLKDNNNEKKILYKLIKYNLISWVVYLLMFLLVALFIPYFRNIFELKNVLLFVILLLGVSLNAHSNISYEYLHASYRVKETIILNILSLFSIYTIFCLTMDRFEIYAIGLAWVGSQIIYVLLIDFIVYKKIGVKASIGQLFFQLILFLLCSLFVFIKLF